MKVSLNWLREYVELPATTEELVSLLTMAGVEVEQVETTGCGIPNVVIAQIKSSEQHPNADRLSVCQVDDGSGTARQIVCGAKNYKVGDKVPLALPGANLPGDFTIKVGKLRGVESQGMMCSGKELGLSGDAEGLLIVSPEAKVGTSIAALYPGDTVLDLEITPNRSDLLSHMGIAMEIGALTGKKIESPKWNRDAIGTGSEAFPVAVEPGPRTYYSARNARGAKVGSSPDWLRRKLETVGLRSINGAVDVTNFVMIGFGQPLHVFDAAKLRGGLRVRSAREGEEFLALDGKTYKLASDDIVIADHERVVAIAGVMGGEHTGVTEGTTEIVLECAWFDPASVRRTSRRLGLVSDSSYRFERSVDPMLTVMASDFAAYMLNEVCGPCEFGKKGSSSNDAGFFDPIHNGRPAIPLRSARLTALLGTDVSSERIDAILTGFGLNKSDAGWIPPTRRPDLTREVDLIEEVTRVVGMEGIPSRVQARFMPASSSDRTYDRAMELRRALIAHGLHEARSITLIPSQPLGLAFTQTSAENLQRVKNPMIDDQVVLRPNLLHGLLTALRENVRAGAASVRLFEIGRVFSTRKPEEFQRCAVVLSGTKEERSWRGGVQSGEYDLFDLKGMLSAALGAGASFVPGSNDRVVLSLAIQVNEKAIGYAGQLWPAEAREVDATAPVLFAEIDLRALASAEAATISRKYTEIPRFPAITRDIALLAPRTLAHAEIEAALRRANEPLLASVELFDVFSDPTGAKIPADKRSLAYSLTYRSPERTLTVDEVNVAHAKLKQRLTSECGVMLRE